MSNLEIAEKFLHIFCSGEPSGLSPLLADDLLVNGTLFTYTSKSEYLTALTNDPPEMCGFRLINATENENSVALFYDYLKADQTIHIAHLFKIKGQQICEMRIIFDGRVFDFK